MCPTPLLGESHDMTAPCVLLRKVYIFFSIYCILLNLIYVRPPWKMKRKMKGASVSNTSKLASASIATIAGSKLLQHCLSISELFSHKQGVWRKYFSFNLYTGIVYILYLSMLNSKKYYNGLQVAECAVFFHLVIVLKKYSSK